MYQLIYLNGAIKDLKRIDKTYQKFLIDNMKVFVKNFSSAYGQELLRTGKIQKIQGIEEELYRLKLRTYRVIYKKENDKLIILVVSVKSRENSYK